MNEIQRKDKKDCNKIAILKYLNYLCNLKIRQKRL